MTALTESKPQHLQALDLANQARLRASKQRSALAAAPPQVLVPALIEPTPELARFKLGALFATRSSKVRRLVPGIGAGKLNRVFGQLEAERPLGRQWHPGLRLGDLTTSERRRLVARLLSPTWRNGPAVCTDKSA